MYAQGIGLYIVTTVASSSLHHLLLLSPQTPITMALNLDALLRDRFLSGQRLPTVPAEGPQGFGRRNYLKLRDHHVHPITCTSTVRTVKETPQASTSLYLQMSFGDRLDLKLEQTTVEELFRLLINGKVGEIDSIGSTQGTAMDNAERTRIAFVSVVLRKIILSMAKPGVNSATVMMNLLAQNDFSKVLWDYFTGRLQMPDTNSANFKSAFAFMDTRVELDKNIKPGDSTYHAHLSIMAAKLAYENEARIRSTVRGIWDMEFLGFYNCWEGFQQSFCTQAFMMSDKPVESGEAELVVVAFRGTDDAYDICTDIDFSWYEIPGVGKVHRGFMKALGLQKNGWPKEIVQNPQTPFAYYTIREKLRDILKKNPKAKFLSTGHSLGGALSALLPIILKYHGEDSLLERLEGVYTFGQPRVGDRRLGQFAENFLDVPKRRYFRFVYSNDMVARVPFDDNTWHFKHFGKCLYYDSMYKGKELKEEPNANYFSAEYALPNFFDAVWELSRSFAIGHLTGPDYEESAFMRMIRIMGLMIPGMPAHSLQEYDNITRLGILVADAREN